MPGKKRKTLRGIGKERRISKERRGRAESKAKKNKENTKKNKENTKKNKENTERSGIALWQWVVILVPLAVAVMWAASVLSVYSDIPVVYEQASPSGVKTLFSLISLFMLTYGAFVVMVFRKNKAE